MEAMAFLAEVDFACYGEILEISSRRIKVRSGVFDCMDTATYTGNEKEMRPLLTLAYFYMEASEHEDDAIRQEAVRILSAIPGDLGRRPFFINMFGPLALGRSRLRAAVMFAMGIRDKEDVMAGLSARIDDLLAAYQLQQQGLCTFREALAL